MNILILGSAGFIGTNLAFELVKREMYLLSVLIVQISSVAKKFYKILYFC